MKGSTKDRSVLEQRDIDMIKNGKKNDVIEKYQKKVLKDNDFKDLEFSFKLNEENSMELQRNLASDAEFLKGYNLTDYSLLLTIHKCNKEDFEMCFKNYRVMKSFDDMYIYNFSIIDYLTV
jgi:hypothetical protein